MSKLEKKILTNNKIQKSILKFLSNEDIISLAQTNKTMNNIIIESNSLILNQLSADNS